MTLYLFMVQRLIFNFFFHKMGVLIKGNKTLPIAALSAQMKVTTLSYIFGNCKTVGEALHEAKPSVCFDLLMPLRQ